MVGLDETQFDLKFRLLNVPVRVHPFFWVMAAYISWQDNKLELVSLGVLCVLVSILVHEYGHALISRVFGCTPSIVLWAMGGLCYSQGERQSPRERLAVVLAGPAAGFVLLGIVMLLSTLIFRITPREHLAVAAGFVGLGPGFGDALQKIKLVVGRGSVAEYVEFAYLILVFVNFYWGVLNLLPIWPLDGGQASQILLTFYDRYRGQRWSHVLSLLVAGGLAVVVYSISQDVFRTVFFGYFAFINYQMLQSLHQAHSMGMYQEDEWWRK